MFFVCIVLIALFVLSSTSNIPSIPLYNAAVDNTYYPMIGLGTGSYCGNGRSNISKPECWNISSSAQATINWFNLGGRRFDNANTYPAWQGVAVGLLNISNNWTTIKREEVFITSKTGPPQPLGYNDTIAQWKEIVDTFQTDYVDLLLIHWPFDNTTHTHSWNDPYCNASNTMYSPSICRQQTWKAYEYIFKNGGAKAIGVSNFEQKHLDDIFNVNSLKPSVNQVEFHGYWHEFNLVEYCNEYDIVFNGYAPLGTPDVEYGNWIPVLTKNEIAINIGNSYNKTAAQVWLRFSIQQNIPVNPRTLNVDHMKENMDIFDFELNQEEMLQLSALTPPSAPKVCPDPNKEP